MLQKLSIQRYWVDKHNPYELDEAACTEREDRQQLKGTMSCDKYIKALENTFDDQTKLKTCLSKLEHLEFDRSCHGCCHSSQHRSISPHRYQNVVQDIIDRSENLKTLYLSKLTDKVDHVSLRNFVPSLHPGLESLTLQYCCIPDLEWIQEHICRHHATLKHIVLHKVCSKGDLTRADVLKEMRKHDFSTLRTFEIINYETDSRRVDVAAYVRGDTEEEPPLIAAE